MPKNSITIETDENYNDWATDVLSEMTLSLFDDPRYMRPVTDDDIEDGVDADWMYVCTRRGQQLLEGWKDRLTSMGYAKFPDGEIDVQNYHIEDL